MGSSIRMKLLTKFYTHGAVNGSWETLEESWPTTSRVKFGGGFVQRSSATSTVIDPIIRKLVILSSATRPVKIKLSVHVWNAG